MSLKRTRTAYGSYSSRGSAGGTGIAIKRTRSSIGTRGGANQPSQRFGIAKAPRKQVSGISPGLRAAVNALIENKKEQKVFVQRPSSVPVGLLITDTATPILPTFFPLVPPIVAGPQSNNRIGDEVRLSKTTLKIALDMSQAAAPGTNGPFLVQLFIGKPLASEASVSNAQWSGLLLGPPNNPQGFNTAAPGTRLLPTDDSTWDIKFRKEYKLGAHNGTNSVNNDFSFAFDDEIDCTAWLSKKVKYNTAAATPVTPQLWYFVVFTTLDGVAPAVTPRLMSSVVTRFTDA